MKRLCWIPLLLVGCVAGSSNDDHAHGHGHHHTVSVKSALTHTVEFDESFKQIGLMYDADAPLYFRTSQHSDWEPVEVTWEEGRARVGVILLDGDETNIEFKSDEPFQNATIQMYDEQIARDFSYDETENDFRVAEQAIAPASLVISRSQWGARNPSKRCGRSHTPTRMAIHHTALPDSDGGDPAARMRQMQAFHIDSRGWCDIGYHFVVSQSGLIYQGRSDERRTGAHVDNANTNKIGISLIGDYEKNSPPAVQIQATQRIMNWVSTTYNIGLNRTNVKGHTEWPGQSTNCPGRNVLSQLDTLLEGAKSPGRASTCDKLEADGVIDNNSTCFTKFGPAQYWRSANAGLGGQMFWTNAWQNDAPGNFARWSIKVPQAGRYKVEYHSASEFAVFNAARYGVRHGSIEEAVTVNLSRGVSGWNEIGEFDFDGRTDESVTIYDNARSQVSANQHIPADAIRVTPVAGGGGTVPPVTGCNPLPAAGGIIDNDSICFDKSGPAEFWRRVEGQGHDGSLLWTNAWRNREASNTAKWNVHVSSPGDYLVEYFSVPEYAIFSSASFAVNHGNVSEDMTIDLGAGVSGWNEIGIYTFTGRSQESVEIFDNASFDVPDDQRIIADAVRITPLNFNVQSSDTKDDEPSPYTDVNGATNKTEPTASNVDGQGGCSTTNTDGSWFAVFAIGLIGLLRRRRRAN